MIGQTISHYRITAQLGSGGMGVVYKAEDTNLDRTVALKFLAVHLLESEEHKQRFLREAKAAASLDHPNICIVHEIGEADGRIFLAMGYIDGPEVRARIKERPLKLDEALDIAMQAAEGLQAAHKKGVVHRDIKSSNLMLTSTGQVKITDFGLAQLTGGTRLTKADSMLGTPSYMSPEQAQRLSTDERTDIWSLGVVVYEMVTGRLPFAGEREEAVVFSIINDPHEPVTALRAGVPLELDRIVGKALAKRPEQRYQHVDDMLVDLRALRTGVGAAALPSPSRRWLWAAASLPVLLVAGFFAWRSASPPEPTEPLRAVALTTFPGAELYPSLSPDSNHVTFTWTGPKQDNTDVYVQQIGAGSPLRLTTDPRGDYNPVWSPDGRWIAFLRGDPPRPVQRSDRELRLIAPLGGPERKLADVNVLGSTPNPVYLGWCPNSKCLVLTDTTGEGKPDALFVISVETGEKRQLTRPQPPVIADTNPTFSPDGESLLFMRSMEPLAGEPYVLPIGRDATAAGEARSIAIAGLKPDYATWLPDGKEILLSPPPEPASYLWRVAVAGGHPARLPFVGEDGVMPVVSRPQPGRSARLVYVRSFKDRNIWRVDTSAAGVAAVSAPVVSISTTKLEGHPQFSPNGLRVVFSSNRSEAAEIWVSDLNGSNAVQLTSLGAQSFDPRWSPDGQWIAFGSNLEGQLEIFVIPAAGGKHRRLTSHPAIDHVPSFSRDGKWIYFWSSRTGQAQVWKVPASGGDAVQVTRDGGLVSFESSDGVYLYYTVPSAVGAPAALWRMATSGGQAVKVLDGVNPFSFALLQRGIYYMDRLSGEPRIQFYDFATHRSTTVARNLGDVFDLGGLAASPDGRTLLYTRIDSSVDDLMLVENFR